MRTSLMRWFNRNDKRARVIVFVGGCFLMPLVGYFIIARVGIAETLGSSPASMAVVSLFAWVILSAIVLREDFGNE